MRFDFFVLVNSRLRHDRLLSVCARPRDSFPLGPKFHGPGPLPADIGIARMVGETPHGVHGRDFGASNGAAAQAGEASRGCSAEFGIEGVEDPDVVLRVGEDVNVHFLEHVEWQSDVVLEAEW